MDDQKQRPADPYMPDEFTMHEIIAHTLCHASIVSKGYAQIGAEIHRKIEEARRAKKKATYLNQYGATEEKLYDAMNRKKEAMTAPVSKSNNNVTDHRAAANLPEGYEIVPATEAVIGEGWLYWNVFDSNDAEPEGWRATMMSPGSTAYEAQTKRDLARGHYARPIHYTTANGAVWRVDPKGLYAYDSIVAGQFELGYQPWQCTETCQLGKLWSKDGAYPSMANYTRRRYAKVKDADQVMPERAEPPKGMLTPTDAAPKQPAPPAPPARTVPEPWASAMFVCSLQFGPDAHEVRYDFEKERYLIKPPVARTVDGKCKLVEEVAAYQLNGLPKPESAQEGVTNAKYFLRVLILDLLDLECMGKTLVKNKLNEIAEEKRRDRTTNTIFGPDLYDV